MTTREARQALFAINSEAADNLRRELFDIREQDEQLPAEFAERVAAILS